MDLILAIITFAFVSSISPGPNNIMLTSSGLNFGIYRSLPQLFGVVIGFPIMILIIGFGLGAVFVSQPSVQFVLKIVGSSYLVYLAYRISQQSQVNIGNTKAKPLTFIQSALFQWVNPKAWIMATSSIATFTNMNTSPYIQVLLIAAIFSLIAIPSTFAWLVFGKVLKKILHKPRALLLFNYAMAILLLLSIAPTIKEIFLTLSL